MGFLRNAALGRIPVVGLLSDLAIVAGAATRVARRSSAKGAARPQGPADWFLVAGAAFRLFQRMRRVRRSRRARAALVEAVD